MFVCLLLIVNCAHQQSAAEKINARRPPTNGPRTNRVVVRETHNNCLLLLQLILFQTKKVEGLTGPRSSVTNNSNRSINHLLLAVTSHCNKSNNNNNNSMLVVVVVMVKCRRV